MNQEKEPSWSSWESSGSCQRIQLADEITTTTVCIPSYNTLGVINARRTCLLEGCRTLTGTIETPGYSEEAELDCVIPSIEPFQGDISCLTISQIQARVRFQNTDLYMVADYSNGSLVGVLPFIENLSQLWDLTLGDFKNNGREIKIAQIRNGKTYGIQPNSGGFIEIGLNNGDGWLLQNNLLIWGGGTDLAITIRGEFLFLSSIANASKILLEVF